MKIKIRKDLFEKLLSKKLFENRTFDNPSGNFIDPLSRKEDVPIAASEHMAIQPSVEAPPVGDPEYVPSSVSELKHAAARIAQEVPSGQIENYYRNLHKLLDAVIDKSNENTLNESNDFSMGGFFDDDGDRYASEYGEGSFSQEAYGDLGSIDDVKKDRIFKSLVKKLKKDRFYDASDEITRLSDLYGVSYSDIEIEIEDAAREYGSGETSIATTPMASKPTPEPVISTPREIEITSDDEDGEMSDEEAFYGPGYAKASNKDEYLSGFNFNENLQNQNLSEEKLEKIDDFVVLQSDSFKLGMDDSIALNKDTDYSADRKIQYMSSEIGKRLHFQSMFWEELLDFVEIIDPVFLVARTTTNMMRVVSSIIEKEESVKFVGSPEQKEAYQGSPEAQAWKGILSNEESVHFATMYRLPAKKKTDEFWTPRVINFIVKMLEGASGSQYAEFSNQYKELVAKGVEYSGSNNINEFLSQVVPLVVNELLRDKDYGALTRNIPSSGEKTLSKLIDAGFSAQIKKNPFNISSNKIFMQRKINPDDLIQHAGEEKTFKQAIIDAIIAYVIVKSDEFKKQRRGLEKDLEKEERDAAIQKIIKDLSLSNTFTYTAGTGSDKASFVITKEDILKDTEAFVDSKFGEKSKKDDSKYVEISDQEFEKMQKEIEDEKVPYKQRKEILTDEIASEIMRNTGSVASFRDYFTRVIEKKYTLAMAALENIDDPVMQHDTNFIGIFNDTLAEIAAPVEKALQELIKEANAEGISREEMEDLIEALVQVKALSKFIYSPETRGGEFTIENLENGVLDIGDEKVNALEFFSGMNIGSAILRYIVSDLIGTKLKGTGMKNIPGIDFDLKKAVKTTAMKTEKDIYKAISALYKGIDMTTAQTLAHSIGGQMGVRESKSLFLEKKDMKTIQPKVSWAFVGRIKKLPDFAKRNASAKNYICWFSAIAAKELNNLSPTVDEIVPIVERIYNEIKSQVDGQIQSGSDKISPTIKNIENTIDNSLSEIEAIEQFTQDQVNIIRRDPEKMKSIVKQAILLHLDDIKYIYQERGIKV